MHLQANSLNYKPRSAGYAQQRACLASSASAQLQSDPECVMCRAHLQRAHSAQEITHHRLSYMPVPHDIPHIKVRCLDLPAVCSLTCSHAQQLGRHSKNDHQHATWTFVNLSCPSASCRSTLCLSYNACVCLNEDNADKQHCIVRPQSRKGWSQGLAQADRRIQGYWATSTGSW